jgi:hypothetical protein
LLFVGDQQYFAERRSDMVQKEFHDVPCVKSLMWVAIYDSTGHRTLRRLRCNSQAWSKSGH